MIYTADVVHGKVNAYKNLEEAEAAEGYTHPDDAFDTELAAWECILSCNIEDLQLMEEQRREAEKWIPIDKKNIKRAEKKIDKLRKK